MKTPRILFPALLGCLGLWGCDADKTTGTMDETNQSASARIFASDLSPAAGAVVQVWKGDDTLRTPVTQTVTENDGSFRIGSLPDGMYRIVARKDGYVAMQDSVPTVAGRLASKNDTLGRPVVMKGRVRMTGSDNPATVTLLVMGTEILANVDKSGTFRVEGLAAGTYRLRLSTTLDEYTTTAAGVRLSGRDSCDVGTIRMNFTGIPPVDSLVARFDSATGNVRLTWSLPQVPDFRFARVYREPLDGSLKPSLVGYTTTGSYLDATPNHGPNAIEWLYTVRIHTMDGDSGYAAWTTVTQKVVKPVLARVYTSIIGYERWYDDSVTPGSTIDAQISAISSPKPPRSLSWSFQGRTGTLSADSFPAGADSAIFRLHLRLDSSRGDYPFVVRMVADDGQTVFDSLNVRVRSLRDTTVRDTARHDSSVTIDTTRRDSIPRTTDTSKIDSTHGLRLDTRVAHLDASIPSDSATLVFVAMSSPSRARWLVWNRDAGASKNADTISLATMPAAPPGSGWPYAYVDSIRVGFELSTVPGTHWIVATLVGPDGSETMDSLSYAIPSNPDSAIDSSVVSATETRALLAGPATEPRTLRGAVPACRADAPHVATKSVIASVLRLEEDA